MRQNGAVQFYGIPAVLQAYENKDIPTFILWWGSQLLHKYEGANIEEGKQELQNFLNAIDSGESVATYTLSVYRKPPKEGVTSKTGYDGSFNFKLHALGYQSGYQQTRSQEISELKAMVQELREQLNEKEETEKPAGIMGVVSGILDNPQVQTLIANRFISFMESLLQPGQAAAVHEMEPPRQLGKVGAVPDEHHYQEQLASINEALPILYANDTLIGDHLLKLAHLAQKEPGQFQLLLGMLDKM